LAPRGQDSPELTCTPCDIGGDGADLAVALQELIEPRLDPPIGLPSQAKEYISSTLTTLREITETVWAHATTPGSEFARANSLRMLVSARYLIEGFGQRITPVRTGPDFKYITLALSDLPQIGEPIHKRPALCPTPPSSECLERFGAHDCCHQAVTIVDELGLRSGVTHYLG